MALWLVFILLYASMLLLIRLVLQQLFLAFLQSLSISSFCLDTFIVYTVWMRLLGKNLLKIPRRPPNGCSQGTAWCAERLANCS
jgi:hypothetical protein